MKQTRSILCIALLFFAGAGNAQEIITVSGNAFGQYSDPYHIPAPKEKKGLLERTKMTIGTIYKSHHFNNNDYNETHNGIYLSVKGWSVGTYRNSGNVQSNFITYNPSLYRMKSVQINLVAGVADGYEGWDYNQNGYLPILGVSAQWSYLKAMMSPEVVAFGLELPLN